jgi:hypothetical protein
VQTCRTTRSAAGGIHAHIKVLLVPVSTSHHAGPAVLGRPTRGRYPFGCEFAITSRTYARVLQYEFQSVVLTMVRLSPSDIKKTNTGFCRFSSIGCKHRFPIKMLDIRNAVEYIVPLGDSQEIPG